MTPAAAPTAFWLLAAGVIGLVIGSFLNVVIVRLPRMMDAEWRQAAAEIQDTPVSGDDDIRLSLARPPSACNACGTRLKPWHNVPVVSYMLLRGRCHHCRTSIGAMYPLVELAAAAVAVAAVLRFGPSPAAASAAVLGWMLLPAAMIDARTGLLPDALTLPALWLGLLASVVHIAGFAPATPSAAIVGAAAGYATLWLLNRGFYLATGRCGMGHGDFKLTAALCAWVGVTMLPLILLLAACFGLLASAGFALTGRPDRARQIAFGPWLALAGWGALMFGPKLLGAYTAATGLH
jgi:leader peptidase (prepilin peptidase)/N-methyltransferase